jgi:hypothetical protein
LNAFPQHILYHAVQIAIRKKSPAAPSRWNDRDLIDGAGRLDRRSRSALRLASVMLLRHHHGHPHHHRHGGGPAVLRV